MAGNNEPVSYLKQGSPDDPRYRGQYVNRRWLAKRIEIAAARAKIHEHVVPYSGRYSWITLYKPVLDRAMLEAMAGHLDSATHDGYDAPQIDARVEQLQGIRGMLEWG